MPSTDPEHEDYECPSCYNNAYPCACYMGLHFGQEVQTLYLRYLNQMTESASSANAGELTYSLEKDGKLIFQRWKYDRDGNLVQISLPPEAQHDAQQLLGKLILSQSMVAV